MIKFTLNFKNNKEFQILKNTNFSLLFNRSFHQTPSNLKRIYKLRKNPHINVNIKFPDSLKIKFESPKNPTPESSKKPNFWDDFLKDALRFVPVFTCMFIGTSAYISYRKNHLKIKSSPPPTSPSSQNETS